MHEKRHDNFFDEDNDEAKAEKQLLTMIPVYDKPVAAALEVGGKVSGKIIKITPQNIFVEIGGKNEAVIESRELAQEDGTLPVNVGDTVQAYVISLKGGVTLSTKLSSKAAADSSLGDIINAMNAALPVEGKVTGVNKGGFNVKIMGQKAFCPVSHIDLKRVEDTSVYLNKVFSFVITRVTENGRNIVVSRLPLLEEEMGTILDSIAENIASKNVMTGTITRIMPFGLFVDIGGFEGLVHISEVSWERSEDLAKSFATGQKVDCIVLSIEKKDPLRQSKISLSMKQVGANPWTTVTATFSAGQTVSGKITRLAGFGAFVQLVPGVEGLIHISEMSWEKRVRHPSDVVAEGQTVTVTILSIDEVKREISCSLKDLASDPWKDIESRFAAGSVVQGTVAQNTKFGYFIDLTEGITGLLPFGNIAQEKKDSLKVGGQLDVTIESIDIERRRVSLSFGKSEEKSHAAEVKQFLTVQKQQKQQLQNMDTEFGAALKNALEKKKA
jgi:small subunit ribosomal protein S1